MSEYQDDPLADDAADSVKLRQAEARALRKRKFKGPQQNKPYGTRMPCKVTTATVTRAFTSSTPGFESTTD